MLFFILYFSISICLSYPTTITSNYTAPPIPPPPVIPKRTTPVLETKLITLFDPSNPMMFLEYIRIIPVTYSQAFSIAPNVLIGIESIADTQFKKGINLKLTLTTTPTTLNITYTDFSGPSSWSIGKLFRVRILAFNHNSLTNAYVQHQDFTLYNTKLVTTKTVPSSWANMDIKIFPFISKMIFPVTSTNLHYILNSIAWIPSTTSLTLEIQAQFLTPFNVSKEIGLFFLFYVQNTTWPISFGDLSFSQSITTKLTDVGLYYFIGLSQYVVFNADRFDFNFNSDSTYLQDPQSGAGSYGICYLFFIINDTEYYSPESFPPIPDPRPESDYHFNLTEIKSYSRVNTSFMLIYQNFTLSHPVNKSQITLNISGISIQQIYIVNNSLIILCKYDQQLVNKNIQIVLTWFKANIEFKAVTNLNLNTSPPLKVYSMLNHAKVLENIAEIIQFFFLLGFVYCLLFSQKLIGIQLITFIQLVFYGQIPLDLKDKMFQGFKKMIYVSGYNLHFQNILKNITIPYCYSSLSLFFNFLSNINIMLVPILVSLLMSELLYCCFRCSNSFKYRPKIKKASIIFLLQVPFTLTLFNLYNINTSLVINFLNIQEANIPILIFSAICSILPIVFGTIYYIFSQKYIEFNRQLENKNKIKCFLLSEQNNKIIAKLYPIILSFQTFITPLLLSNPTSFTYCFYIVLSLNILITVFVIVCSPYKQKLNNIRLFVHRILLLLAIINFVVIKNAVNEFLDFDSAYYYLAWIFIVLLITDWIINVIYSIFKIFNKSKASKKSKREQNDNLNNENNQDNNQNVINDKIDPVYYPILQYGKGRQRRQKQRRQKQRQRYSKRMQQKMKKQQQKEQQQEIENSENVVIDMNQKQQAQRIRQALTKRILNN